MDVIWPKGETMKAIVSVWVLFTVALLALLISCPKGHAQTLMYTLEEQGHGLLLVRKDGTIAITEEPNGYVCIGLEPYRADCHPALNLPPTPEGFPEEGQ